MPYESLPLANTRCFFNQQQCRRDCAAALLDANHREVWQCRWLNVLDAIVRPFTVRPTAIPSMEDLQETHDTMMKHLTKIEPTQ